jgi:protein phosphatase
MVLLTTDGVHGTLESAQMERILASAPADPGCLASELVNAAIAAGSRDNCTAVVAQFLG